MAIADSARHDTGPEEARRLVDEAGEERREQRDVDALSQPAAVALAEQLGLGSIITLADGVRGVASPITLDATPVRYRRAPPALDADGEELRTWLERADGTSSR